MTPSPMLFRALNPTGHLRVINAMTNCETTEEGGHRAFSDQAFSLHSHGSALSVDDGYFFTTARIKTLLGPAAEHQSLVAAGNSLWKNQILCSSSGQQYDEPLCTERC